MVSCRLQGGTGNQMFQIATTMSLAMKYNSEYKIPNVLHNDFKRKITFNHFPISSDTDIKFVYNEPSFTYNEIQYKDGICLNGYFQSDKYFIEHREQIIDAFKIPYKKKQGFVSLHIRRGDYLSLPDHHPVVSMDYIKKAIEYFTGKEYNNFLVFSDDMDWCKINLNSNNFPLCAFQYSENKNEIDDMELMSSCEHNIIANSSFSWWGAWLNRNPDKIVIAPKTWFGKLLPHDTSDLLPSEWIRF